MWLLLQASTSAARELPGGYGASLVQSLLALAAVCILAWVVLRWSAQRGLGTGAGQRVQVIERVPLDARRWVYLVKIGERVLVLGAGDGASPTLLTELAAKDLPDAPRTRSFLEVLRAGTGTDASSDASRESSAATREGSAATREGSAATREGSAATREGSAATREGSAATREGSVAERSAP